ncbi:cobalt transport family protein [Saccharibacillus sp. O23]|uniref:energy-coupling factor transporter transmembrane component T family protein n=1 Tax=Saccharibacillus sp. O23 TaxID=2009338 RepID=UPI000B4E7A71|nr:energy-coupling factor transporter transmembrane component T [Saccharibacillus sp. O23]OWR32591.1 cobalt transport family protein [Saccharibacillus sp. O23]
MSDNLLIGQFIRRDSVIHRLDPRTKLIGMVLLMIALIRLDSWIGYALASAFVLVTAGMSRFAPRLLLKGLLPVLPILAFTLLYHLFFGRGETILWAYGGFVIRAEGMQEGVRLVWRILLMILLASILTGTTRPMALAKGLETLSKPLSRLGVPVEQFALMIVMAVRFIPTIGEELERILLAQKARGHDISALPPVKRLFAFIPILVPLLVTTVQRAEQLSLAIEARGYGDGRGRTVYRPLTFASSDYWALSFLLVIGSILWAIG